MITFFFITLAGFFNAIMDTLKSPTYYDRSIFPKSGWWSEFLDHRKSWTRKWKPGTREERFPGSSTVFVFLTDGWHLAQALMIACFLIGVICYEGVFGRLWDFVIMFGMFNVVFEIFFSKFLVTIKF